MKKSKARCKYGKYGKHSIKIGQNRSFRPIMYILSTKFRWLCHRFCHCFCQCFCLAGVFLLCTCFLACAGNAGMRPIKSRVDIALIIPSEYATLSMRLHENYNLLRRRVRRELRGRPRLQLHMVTWQEFLRSNAYVTYDAMIYIGLYRHIPSDLANSLSNRLGRGFLEMLDSPVFSRFRPPRRFIWLLFDEAALLDQYRLRYPDSFFVTTNTGAEALREVFGKNLYQFLERLQEFYR